MRRVCFLGTAKSGLEEERLIAEIPEAAELWVVNEAHHRLGNRIPSRVFQLHVRDWRELERHYLASGADIVADELDHSCFGRNEEHVEYLRTCGVPVYGQRVWDDIPTSIRYPFEDVRSAVGIALPPYGHKRLWATSSFGYMAALVVTEHVNAIDYPDRIQELLLYGIELPLGTPRERLWEWPNLAYYLGLATGLGIKVSLPSCGSALLSAPHYALDGRPKPGDPDHWWWPGPAAVIVDSTEPDGGVLRLGREGSI